MKTIGITKFRKNLAACIDTVNNDCVPLLVTRPGGRNAVLVSEDDYASIEETLYLLSNPENAKRLRESIRELDASDPTHGTKSLGDFAGT